MAEIAKRRPRPWYSSRRLNRQFSVGRLDIGVEMRRNDGWMGRFGGGWNWKLGIQAGGNTVIVSLLVMEVRLDWKAKATGRPS